METTLLIKLKKDVKKQASHLAGEIGVPLSTLISAFLKNFIREKKITLSVEPEVSKAKIRKWEKIVEDYKMNPNGATRITSLKELDAFFRKIK